MSIQTVYKVVSQSWKDYRFLSASVRAREFMREYALNTVTTPADGTKWLMAFSNLNDAFLYCTAYHSIMECEADVIGEADVFMPYPINESLHKYWTDERTGKFSQWDSIELLATPKGTILCTWIKPLKFVGDWKPAEILRNPHRKGDDV